ncbi:MAG TPA: TatD family hydrolase [Actinomycetota bacterium]|nr:TatD family hydrolase [Actinomycetota bacterium]
MSSVSPGWFDSHCHLQLCDDPPNHVVARAADAGVSGIMTAAIDLASSREVLEIATSVDVSNINVVVAVGIHPNSANEHSDDAMTTIEEWSARPEVVAIGESGLDFFRDHVAPDVQERSFRDHIGLATRSGKALVIHTRASIEAALDILEEVGPPPRLIFHCWSGDDAALERAVALGAHISFAGNVTFKNAPELRAAAERVPDDRLLVETDSPYLAPEPHRGRPNEPGFVGRTGEVVAGVRGMDAGAARDMTSANALAVFGLS